MKKLILFALFLIVAFSLSVFAQKTQIKKPTEQTTNAPNKKKDDYVVFKT